MSKIITLKDGNTIIYPRTISKQVIGNKKEMGDVQGFIDSLVPVVESPYKYYTVRIDLNNPDPETSCTYMEDAVSMTPGYDGWKDTNLISGIRPCAMGNNGEIVGYYTNKEDMSQGYTQTLAPERPGEISLNTMIEFPLMGYKLWNDDSYQYVSVTDDPNAEDKGYCYYAHSLNTEKDCDKIYIGAFLGYVNPYDNILHSVETVGTVFTPTTDTSLTDFRTYAANCGSGYSLVSFYPWTLLQCLYVIIYKNLNSQVALGKGYTNASAVDVTGTTLSQPFCYGDPNDGTKHVKFLGIEDFYGNTYQWLDGIYSDTSNLLTDYRNSQMTGRGHDFQFSTAKGTSSGYYGNISKIMGTNTSGFTMANGGNKGSDSTYFSDFSQIEPSCFGYYSGCWDYDAGAGAFYLLLGDSASGLSSDIGARLMYKHLASSGGAVTPEPDVLNVTCYDLSRMFQNNITTTTLPQWVLMNSNQTDEDTTMVTISDSMLTSEESVELLCFFDTLWMCYTVIVANKKYDMRPIDININIDCSEYLQKRNIIDNFATSIISKDNESYNTEIIIINDVNYDDKIYTIEILNNNSGVPESDVYYCSLIIPMATFEQYLNSDKTLNINIVYTDESYPVM